MAWFNVAGESKSQVENAKILGENAMSLLGYAVSQFAVSQFAMSQFAVSLCSQFAVSLFAVGNAVGKGEIAEKNAGVNVAVRHWASDIIVDVGAAVSL